MTSFEEPLKYCLYARKSSEADERQALSIDSQINEMKQLALKEGIEVVDIKRESKSAKDSGGRRAFNELIKGLQQQEFNAILTWAPDRLSRNAGDLGSLVDLMDSCFLKEIRTFSQKFTNNPNEKFLLMILCSQAKLENDNRGINVKRGLRAKCERGVRPGCVPLGYKLIRSDNFREPSKTIIDKERAPYIRKMFEYVIKNNLSGRQVNEYLTDEGFRTKSGKPLTLSMTYRVFKQPFYYGEFEYPKGSGTVYQGSHEPLVTKEDFLEANIKLKTSPKGKWGRKDFYFSKLFKCGSCGSGISGEERINRHGKQYLYYKCNKYGGKNRCKEKYIREEKLIESIARFVDELKENHFRLSRRIQHEVEKLNDLQKINGGAQVKALTSQNYIEYILKSGTAEEKRELLKCIHGELILSAGKISLFKLHKLIDLTD
jgi:site-specific DNA recombinase